MEKYIQAGKFKVKCLKIMDSVKKNHKEIIITKHSLPIVRLCPIENASTELFGKLAGTIHIKSDIITPIDEKWDANY